MATTKLIKVTPEMIFKIRKMRKAGKTYDEIQREVGVLGKVKE
jgi:hypothetical protein